MCWGLGQSGLCFLSFRLQSLACEQCAWNQKQALSISLGFHLLAKCAWHSINLKMIFNCRQMIFNCRHWNVITQIRSKMDVMLGEQCLDLLRIFKGQIVVSRPLLWFGKWWGGGSILPYLFVFENWPFYHVKKRSTVVILSIFLTMVTNIGQGLGEGGIYSDYWNQGVMCYTLLSPVYDYNPDPN